MSWWLEVVFGDWRTRPGPQYRRIAAALLEAIEGRLIREGVRLPAERPLAVALGVSRGTVVASYGHLADAGVVRHFQGSGSFVIGTISWVARPSDNTVAVEMLRKVAEQRETIDLSFSAPADRSHLPLVNVQEAWDSLVGSGLDPAGMWSLRVAIAKYLCEYHDLPTEPDQIVVTSGAQEAIAILSDVLEPRSGALVTTCPSYRGLHAAFGYGDRQVICLPSDSAGAQTREAERFARKLGTVIYLMPSGHNPLGSVMSDARRQAFAGMARFGRAAIIEDLSLADLVLDDVEVPAPIAKSSDAVIVIGSLSKIFWSGLRIGWIRAKEPLHSAIVARKSSLSGATASLDQALAVQLLDSLTRTWLAEYRAALRGRRDFLIHGIGTCLPSWRTQSPAAGLSLWIEIPVHNADAYAHVAARHGVSILPGGLSCLDSHHGNFIRVSFAEQLGTLELATERLAIAWESYTQDLAAGPSRE